MSYIATSKFGVCSICGGAEQNVVKVKRDLFCLSCNQRMKAEEQIRKQKLRNASRQAGTKLRGLATENVEVKAPKDYAELDRWFKDRRKEMTGKCSHCSGVSCKHDDKYFKFSICHILPKAYFKSVATHPDNWIELCHFGNSCHSQMDNKMLDLIDMNCFDTIIQKFAKMYPFIAQEEKRRIPPILIEYLKTEI